MAQMLEDGYDEVEKIYQYLVGLHISFN